MEQKNYKLEIVSKLIEKNFHARALAKELKTNHMAIVRKIKELFNENILDYKEEGKNKVYFIKDTSEARSYVLMAEYYKLNQLLKKYPSLRNIIQNIQKNKKIKLALIFGSYAKSLAKKESDIDVYIETDNKKIKQELELLNSKVSVKIGKYNEKSLLAKEILKNHVIIKGVEIFYEKY